MLGTIAFSAITCAAVALYAWLGARRQGRINAALEKRVEAQEKVLREVVRRDALGPVLGRLAAVLEEFEEATR